MDPHPVVLLVQPERDDRRMYAEYLQLEGFRPIPVSTAEQALRLAARADVVVAGILLPGPSDGIELITRLKADERTRRTPVIVLTTCAWKSDRDRAEAAGCEGFLTKPCLPSVLLREIHRLLALREVPKPSAAKVPRPPPPRSKRSS